MSVHSPISASKGAAPANMRSAKEEAKAVEAEEGHVTSSQPFQAGVQKASVLVSFIVLANNILGSGMLGLPYAYSNTGWYLGSFLIIAAGTSKCICVYVCVLYPSLCACLSLSSLLSLTLTSLTHSLTHSLTLLLTLRQCIRLTFPFGMCHKTQATLVLLLSS